MAPLKDRAPRAPAQRRKQGQSAASHAAHREPKVGPADNAAAPVPPDLILPAGWSAALSAEVQKPYFAELLQFVAAERALTAVYPREEQVFFALQVTAPAAVRVVILGQDPYHGAGQAHGLAFSVPPGVTPPPSLRNIFKELREDLAVDVPEGAGCLTGWAEQGVLLLNSVLTVRAGKAGSHRGHGWEQLTDAVIASVAALPVPPIFVLWGGPAQQKAALLEPDRHTIFKSAHPSPLSAWNGFLGSRPFSAVNRALSARGQEPIDWSVVR